MFGKRSSPNSSPFSFLMAGLLLGSSFMVEPALAAPPAASPKPTIVLVHGAFADASSWNGVIAKLVSRGYPVVAAANPLRSVQGDAAYVAGILKSIAGPKVLVGHSYGGSVISTAANADPLVKALVYVAAFAPDVGETAAGLSGKFPGSSLGPTLGAPVALADGGKDLYIQLDKFPAQFAADMPKATATLMAVTQRPITEAALNEPSGAPAWKNVPTWFVHGGKDLNIPPAALAFMAERAKSRKTVVIDSASHVVMTSHPAEVASLIELAASAK